MNIGISCYPTHGGSGVLATELGLELARRGHGIHFLSYNKPFRLDRPYPNVQIPLSGPFVLVLKALAICNYKGKQWHRARSRCVRP